MKLPSIAIMASLLSLSHTGLAGLEIGKLAPEITLSGDAGGRVDGTAWSASEIKDKVFIMFYVDPDMKDLNEDVADAIKAKEFPQEKFSSIAVVNMAATWKPDMFIASALEEKQKKFPRTTYVKDIHKALVKSWGFEDDNYCIALFNQKGELVFRKDGKFSEQDKTDLISLIQKTIDESSTSS